MKCHFLIAVMYLLTANLAAADESLNDDMLHPYEDHRRFRRQSTVKITHKVVNTSDYESWVAHNSSSFLPVANTRYFVADIRPFHRYVSDTHVYGHHTVISNPSRTFSVLETRRNACGRGLQATVVDAARENDCLVAQNGGYFNTKTLSCYGSIVSNGKLIQTSNVQNVHFGLTANGSIITGYLTENVIRAMDFTQLVGGVLWLVRNGTSFVEKSLKLEDCAEETGTLKYFADVQSARTAIGHDKHGRVVLVQLDGQTNTRGPDLFGFAKFMIDELGLVNAINLDGGGSATLALNGTLASYPSDHCKSEPKYRCARKVSTVVCAHRATCLPPCIHGTCQDGMCDCDVNWKGIACDKLKCSEHNCMGNGNCTKEGCVCHAGWHGDRCGLPCEQGSFGVNCTQACRCKHHSHCEPHDGTCHCLPGYHGTLCDEKCLPGKYGSNCSYTCHCSDSCICHPETGSCLQSNHLHSYLSPNFVNMTKCLAANLWNMTSRVEETSFALYSKDNTFIVSLLCGSIGFLIFSLAANFLFLWKSFSSNSDPKIPQDIPITSDTSSDDVIQTSASDDVSDGDVLVTSSTNFRTLWSGLSRKFFGNSGAKYKPLGTSEEVFELGEVTPLQRT